MSGWLVVGLGNPGPRYAATRHNLGATVVCELARRYAGGHGATALSGAPLLTTDTRYLRAHKSRAAVAQVRLAEAPGQLGASSAVLAVPTAYMNESGGPVKALLRFYRLTPEQVVVVHDELDIPSGTIRLKRGGGEGGHNGLRSVSAALGTRDYLRVRAGIGRPPGRMDPTDYVLREFGSAERAELPLTVSEAADATVALVTLGLTEAQQRYHIPRQPPGENGHNRPDV